MKIKIILFIICVVIFSCTEQYRYGFINKNGEIIIDAEYHQAFPFNEGLAAVCKKDKFGFIDKSGNVVIDFKYDIAQGFREGLALVGKKNKFGYIDKRGQLKIPFEYDKASAFINGIAGVVKNGKTGYINKNGILIINHKFDNISFLSNGLICAELNKKYGFINKEGKVIIDFKYNKTYPFFGGYAYVRVDTKNGYRYGIINKKDDFVVDPIYEDISDVLIKKYSVNELLKNHVLSFEEGYFFHHVNIKKFNSGLLLVKKENKYGFINKKGEIEIDLKYSHATIFQNNFAVVTNEADKKKYCYLINTKNDILKKIEYPLASFDFVFNDNIIMILDGKKRTYYRIDKEQKLTNKNYDIINMFYNGYAIVGKDEKWGIIDKSGNEIVKLEYDHILPFSEELAVIKLKK